MGARPISATTITSYNFDGSMQRFVIRATRPFLNYTTNGAGRQTASRFDFRNQLCRQCPVCAFRPHDEHDQRFRPHYDHQHLQRAVTAHHAFRCYTANTIMSLSYDFHRTNRRQWECLPDRKQSRPQPHTELYV